MEIAIGIAAVSVGVKYARERSKEAELTRVRPQRMPYEVLELRLPSLWPPSVPPTTPPPAEQAASPPSEPHRPS